MESTQHVFNREDSKKESSVFHINTESKATAQATTTKIASKPYVDIFSSTDPLSEEGDKIESLLRKNQILENFKKNPSSSTIGETSNDNCAIPLLNNTSQEPSTSKLFNDFSLKENKLVDNNLTVDSKSDEKISPLNPELSICLSNIGSEIADKQVKNEKIDAQQVPVTSYVIENENGLKAHKGNAEGNAIDQHRHSLTSEDQNLQPTPPVAKKNRISKVCSVSHPVCYFNSIKYWIRSFV